MASRSLGVTLGVLMMGWSGMLVAGESAAAPAAPAVQSAGVVKAVATQVKAADRLLARKRWVKAEAGYRKALAADPDSAPARFGLAATLARRSKGEDAVRELDRLARGTREDAPVWLVEARTSAHFAALRGDPGYRRAVGIDPDPTRTRSAYERLVGQGGQWEQPGQPCQEPTVGMRLDRKKRSFVLRIRNRCQGEDETTTLDGAWSAEGTGALVLRFPNPSGPDEALRCALAESGSEDALSCTLEDLAITMRVVRR